MLYQTSAAQTISYVISWARDLGVFGVTIVIGWNARGIYQKIDDFTTDIRDHMKRMDAFAVRMETNHLKHMESYLYRLAKSCQEIAPSMAMPEDLDPPQEVDPHASSF